MELDLELIRKRFGEFTNLELQYGGPDPQLTTVKHITWTGTDLREKVWVYGCYGAFHSTPPAEVIWNLWPLDKVLKEGDTLEGWLTREWAGITMRTERRCVRTPRKLTRYLRSMATWADVGFHEVNAFGELDPVVRYEHFWKQINKQCMFVGRYIALKILYMYEQNLEVGIGLSDMRAKGAWSPRETLALLWPEERELLTKGEDPATLARVDEIFHATHALSSWHIGDYVLQVLLCEFREALIVGRYYPGRSLDEDLEAYTKIKDHWAGRFESKFFGARAELFSPNNLGEKFGWDGLRKELGKVVQDHGYFWNDLQFCYVKTEGNFASPALWEGTEVPS